MKVFIAGDFCETYRTSEYISAGNVSYLLDGLGDSIKQSDFSIVNFEFPIVSGDYHVAIKKCGPNLKGTAASAGFIKAAGFNACTLANNHILDWGAPAALQTKEILEKNGLSTVGFGENNYEANKILYFTKDGETIAIINCCEHEFSVTGKEEPGANALDPVAQYYAINEAKAKADHVIVIVHGGIEMLQLPTFEMKKNFHFFIDSGADVVVNHHQHCFSGVEEYKGKYIFYGLGNFLFDWEGKRNSSWNEGMAVTIDFCPDSISYSLHCYTQCNDDPIIRVKDSEDALFSKYSLPDLHRIITCDNELKELLTQYYQESCGAELTYLEPYQGYLSSRLFAHGLLPSSLTMKKVTYLLNRISCESHREKLIFALKQWIKNH